MKTRQIWKVQKFQQAKISAYADYKKSQKIQKNNIIIKFNMQMTDSTWIIKKIISDEEN